MTSIRVRLLKWLLVPLLVLNLIGAGLAYWLASSPGRTVFDQTSILTGLVWLEAGLALVLAAVIWLALGRGLQPLKKMTADLEARSDDDLSALEQRHVPLELSPVVTAINRLLDKVQQDAKAQQNFLANMAHQLRTPLAGFRTQLEWLRQKHAGEPESAHSIALMT
ncbi:MAG: ATP-binding region, ATPase-like:Histidine kinase, partial [Collimonas fungivorans]|uniref:histidine kinase dimerization/phospho-acceptor domain-containing protein n=1 Tax=Collimonas fungivorans TaxID=158899 RepID=UPI0026F16118